MASRGTGRRKLISPTRSALGGVKRPATGSWESDNDDKLFEEQPNVQSQSQHATPSVTRTRRGGKRPSKTTQVRPAEEESEENPSPITPPAKVPKRPLPKSAALPPPCSAPRKLMIPNSVSPGGLLWPSKLDSVLAMGAPSSRAGEDESPAFSKTAAKRGQSQSFREPDSPFDAQPSGGLKRSASVLELPSVSSGKKLPTGISSMEGEDLEVDDEWQESEEEPEIPDLTPASGTESMEELFRKFSLAQRAFFASMASRLQEYGSVLAAQKTMNARIRAQQTSHSEKLAKLRKALGKAGEFKTIGQDEESDN